ncbi:MAG: hypothetical protein HKO70_12140 [Acidimicrobiia bacterium]|nr:hypothetical protein [Acidimicrobiia bacterium]
MDRVRNLDRYLSAHFSDQAVRAEVAQPTAWPFVTISRQAGAGAHALASALLANFAEQADVELFAGWQVFDSELCELVAEDPTYAAGMSALIAEQYRTRTTEFFGQVLSPTIDQDMLMNRVFRVVAAVASAGKSIIIGRAGSEVTRGLGTGLSIRLVAPEAVRIIGMMDHYGLDERAAQREARRLDAARARLLKTHFQADIDDPLRYDVTWNTGAVPVPVIAATVTAAIRRLASPAHVKTAP